MTRRLSLTARSRGVSNRPLTIPIAITMAFAVLLAGCELSQYLPPADAGSSSDTTSGADTRDAVSTTGHTGRVTYLKRVRDASANETTRVEPAPRVTVKLLSGGQVVRTGETDDDGNYSLAGTGDTIVVVAQSVGPRINITVYPEFPDGGGEAPWEVTGTGDIHIDERYAAGAFNVVALAVQLTDTLAGVVPSDVPEPLEVRWREGYTAPCAACFFASTYRMELTGQSGDEDAHDDCVVLHELGHWTEAAFGTYSNPGGAHDLQDIAPTLAWSEGYATWVQAAIRNVADHIDVYPGGAVYYLDLESIPASTYGASDPADPTSDHSEALVYGLLWDLLDGGNGDDDDDDASFDAATIWRTAFSLTTSGDIGVAGADLTDFINRWRCSVSGGDDALALLVSAFQFPVSFSSPASCP